MRLIDADALKNAFLTGKQSGNFLIKYYDVMLEIDNAPTIMTEEQVDLNEVKAIAEEAEQKRQHGEWIVGDVYPIKYFCKCSNCGTKYVTSVSGDVSIIDFNFCPNCGSDMRGEEE